MRATRSPRRFVPASLFMVCCYVLMHQQCLCGPQRRVYPTCPNGKFWNKVNEVLDSIKSMPEEKKFRYVVPARSDYNHSLHSPSSFLKAILNHDRRAHAGVTPSTIATIPSDGIATGDEPLIQQRIQDLVEAPEVLLHIRGPRNGLDTRIIYIFEISSECDHTKISSISDGVRETSIDMERGCNISTEMWTFALVTGDYHLISHISTSCSASCSAARSECTW